MDIFIGKFSPNFSSQRQAQSAQTLFFSLQKVDTFILKSHLDDVYFSHFQTQQRAKIKMYMNYY